MAVRSSRSLWRFCLWCWVVALCTKAILDAKRRWQGFKDVSAFCLFILVFKRYIHFSEEISSKENLNQHTLVTVSLYFSGIFLTVLFNANDWMDIETVIDGYDGWM